MTSDKIMIRTIRMRGNRDEVMMIMTNGEKGQMMWMKRMERNEGSQLNGIGNGDWQSLTEWKVPYMLQRKEPLLENDDHDCGERRGGEWEERNEGAQLARGQYYTILYNARGQGAAPPCLARLCHSEPYCAYCVVPPCHSLPTVPYPPQYGTLCTKWHGGGGSREQYRTVDPPMLYAVHRPLYLAAPVLYSTYC